MSLQLIPDTKRDVHYTVVDQRASTLIVVDGTEVGYLSTYIEWPRAYIGLIEIDEQYQKRGIASEVLDIVEDEWRDMGIREVRAVSVVPEAVDFWKKNGYRIRGEYPHGKWSKRL